MGNEGYDIGHHLMLIEDSVDNYGNNGSQVGFPCNFNKYDNETAGLEDSTAAIRSVKKM